MSGKSISRRNMVKGAAALAAAGAAAGLGASAASADEAAGQTYADTIAWDAEYDVVVCGMGFAGMVSAVNAADAGASVLIVEKAPEGAAGGNSKVCGQGWADGKGDVEASIAYYKALAGGANYPEDMMELIGTGVAGMTDRIASYGLDPADFMDVKAANLAPEYPELAGGPYIPQVYAHDKASDGYLYDFFKTKIATDYAGKIDVWYESPAKDLFQEPELGTVLGVKVERGGAERNVRALSGVVLAAGGFEANPDMIQNYLGLTDYAYVGGSYNTGDAIMMAARAGARLWHMDVYEGTFGLLSLGYKAEPGTFNPAARISTGSQGAMNTGFTVVVGAKGRRFGDESYVCRHGHNPDGNGEWKLPQFTDATWVIWDKTQMDAIDESGRFNEDYRDTIVECATVDDIAAATGCDAETLAQTLSDFDSFASAGYDPQFERDPATMRAFDGGSYFVMPLTPSVLNTQGGPERNVNAELLDVDGEPIPHLYGAGEMGNSTVRMYQSGSNVAECFIMGEIAGKSAAAAKDPLPAYAGTAVESSPKHVGEETDLAAE